MGRRPHQGRRRRAYRTRRHELRSGPQRTAWLAAELEAAELAAELEAEREARAAAKAQADS